MALLNRHRILFYGRSIDGIQMAPSHWLNWYSLRCRRLKTFSVTWGLSPKSLELLTSAQCSQSTYKICWLDTTELYVLNGGPRRMPTPLTLLATFLPTPHAALLLRSALTVSSLWLHGSGILNVLRAPQSDPRSHLPMFPRCLSRSLLHFTQLCSALLCIAVRVNLSHSSHVSHILLIPVTP